ncbi:MAG: 4Fe-4S binding protein [Bacillota bacterium]|nr:4Fe-4S binding protein [Bacillota bacterium]
MINNQQVTKNVILRFSPDVVDRPIVYELVTEYHLIPNIIKASVNPEREGYIVLGLTGTEDNFERGVFYMQGLGMEVQLLADRVSWDDNICTQCGACTAVCPAGALSLRRPEMELHFDSEKCIVCHMCIEACPVSAVHLDF